MINISDFYKNRHKLITSEDKKSLKKMLRYLDSNNSY